MEDVKFEGSHTQISMGQPVTNLAFARVEIKKKQSPGHNCSLSLDTMTKIYIYK